MTTAAGSTPSGAEPGADPLTVEVDRSATPPIIALAGELDPHTAPVLEREIDGVLAAGPTDLVLDLSALGFVDSSGLRVLIAAQHRLADDGKALSLRSPSETVRRLLEITGLIDHITITER